jgi:hypothetical protein
MQTRSIPKTKHEKKRPRERGGDNFCLAYTGLRVDDITAEIESLCGAEALTRRCEKIFPATEL